MALIAYQGHSPKLGEQCFIAPDAWVIGQAHLGQKVSVFFGAVLRGDIQPIEVGQGSNIQEHAVLHTSHGLTPCIVGKNVTIGHRAIIHGCTISDECIIGMGSIILDGTVIGRHSIVGAGSVVPMNKTFPERSLLLGSPAKVVRELTDKEIDSILDSALRYQKTGNEFLQAFLDLP